LEVFVCHQWDGTFQKWNLWNIHHMSMRWIFKCSGFKPKKKGICNHFGHYAHRFRWVLQEAAAFKLGHNKMKAAASMFEQLLSSSSTMVKMEALNGLVCSTAFSEPIKARSYEKQLPPLPGLSALNAEALERAAPTKRGRVGEDRVEATKTGDGKLDKVRPARKRKRKPLYPKGFDPANPGPPPDPERWLPKRERSSFRPKKKDKRNAQIRGAQGSVMRDKSVDIGGANGNVSSIVTGPRPAADGKKGNSSMSSEVTVPHPSTGSRKGKKKGRQQS
jgi:signal recognition particle subunit SRP72